jgi:hypothetical protein
LRINLPLLFGLLLLWCCPPIANAQSTYRIGTLPAINLNQGLAKGWSCNFKWESRQWLDRNDIPAAENPGFDYLLSDFSLLGAKKVGLNNGIAGGYLLRLREGKATHRAIQQFTVVRRYRWFRMGYRLAADQTFAPDESLEWRLRFRMTAEFPLSGESLDPREFYLKVNNEYLNGWQGGDHGLELRLVPLLGYYFTDNRKVEFGLDYRLSSLTGAPRRHTVWIALTGYFKFAAPKKAAR